MAITTAALIVDIRTRSDDPDSMPDGLYWGISGIIFAVCFCWQLGWHEALVRWGYSSKWVNIVLGLFAYPGLVTMLISFFQMIGPKKAILFMDASVSFGLVCGTIWALRRHNSQEITEQAAAHQALSRPDVEKQYDFKR